MSNPRSSVAASPASGECEIELVPLAPVFHSFTSDEAEIIFSVNAEGKPQIQRVQKLLAKKWYLNFHNGDQCERDLWKAQKYAAIAEEPYIDEPSKTLRINHFYTAAGWFNSTRLFLIRVDRCLPFIPTVLRPTFLFLSISYALECIVDGIMITKAVIFPQTNEEKELSEWDRFKRILDKDNRKYRLGNAFVWFFANLPAVLVYAGITAIAVAIGIGTGGMGLIGLAGLAGFAFDIYNEYQQKSRNIKKYDDALEKIKNRFKVIYQSLNNPALDQTARDNLKNEQEQLESVESELEEKLKNIKKDGNRNIFITTGLFIGMVLINLFPPAAIAYKALYYIGAGMALGIGSLYGGFGRRVRIKAVEIFNQLKNFINKCMDKSPTLPLIHPSPSLASSGQVIQRMGVRDQAPATSQHIPNIPRKDKGICTPSLSVRAVPSVTSYEVKATTTSSAMYPRQPRFSISALTRHQIPLNSPSRTSIRDL